MVRPPVMAVEMWRLPALSTFGPVSPHTIYQCVQAGAAMSLSVLLAESLALPTRGHDRPCRDDSAAKPPFDLARLRRFTRGNLELEQELIGLFATQAPIMLEALRRADTPQAWRDVGHTLRGSSASIGAWLVADAAERAEGLVGSPGAWDGARRDVAAAIDCSLAYLADPRRAI